MVQPVGFGVRVSVGDGRQVGRGGGTRTYRAEDAGEQTQIAIHKIRQECHQLGSGFVFVARVQIRRPAVPSALMYVCNVVCAYMRGARARGLTGAHGVRVPHTEAILEY